MKLKVLVVEDEKLIRDEICLTTPWDRFSCEVVGAASNGLEGEDLFHRLQPDIVVTDIRMPGLSGIEMLKNINPPAALILTGHSDFEYARSAIKLGVKDYILKPVDDKEFYDALGRISEKLITSRRDIQSFREYIGQPEGDKQDYYTRQAVEFIEANYPRQISLVDAADYCGISESYLSRLFKERTGSSFQVYLRHYRLKKALELMQDRNRRINEIARETGFRDMSYFGSEFRKYAGMSPSEYQKGYRPEEP
ncbi:MAG: helix-turn-helix domain-containing protein [Spirochaetales bacterium]|nr:helix-turn-helix domain-containing protein [Spirochaetales bacterium]